MENKDTNEFPKSYAMYEGRGPYSYNQNSDYQRQASEIAQDIIAKEIINKLDVPQVSLGLSQSFKIADFGCSTGPNTFLTVQAIVEALELKVASEGQTSPAFQVFFNDLVSNDFNTLFTSLPPERRYYAAGIPGSFHGRLFPDSFLHIVYSSFTLNWLSDVPKEVRDKTSPAWNGGRIHYNSKRKEVLKAYSNQFAEDLEHFLLARAHELVGGGLVALILPGLVDKMSFSQTTGGLQFEIFESCLVEMGRKGLVSEEEVNSFNLPLYYPYLKEVEAVIKRNENYFSTERIEVLTNPRYVNTKSDTRRSTSTLHLRAVFDGLINSHFGRDLTNALFDEYSEAVAECTLFNGPDIQTLKVLVVVLKRKAKS